MGKGMGHFNMISINNTPKLNPNGTLCKKRGAISCDCNAFQKFGTCYETKRFELVINETFPRAGEIELVSPKFSDLAAHRTKLIANYTSLYCTAVNEQPKIFQGSLNSNMSPPPKNPFLSLPVLKVTTNSPISSSSKNPATLPLSQDTVLPQNMHPQQFVQVPSDRSYHHHVAHYGSNHAQVRRYPIMVPVPDPPPNY